MWAFLTITITIIPVITITTTTTIVPVTITTIIIITTVICHLASRASIRTRMYVCMSLISALSGPSPLPSSRSHYYYPRHDHDSSGGDSSADH